MKKINFLARLFNCSLVFLFISCGGGGGDGSGDNPLDDPFGTLNENEPPDPAFKGDWDIVETLKQSSCPASGNTSEGFIEFSNGECFLYGAGNDGISVEEDLCKVAGKKGVIYTAGSLQRRWGQVMTADRLTNRKRRILCHAV